MPKGIYKNKINGQHLLGNKNGAKGPNKTIALSNYRIGIIIESPKYGTIISPIYAGDYHKVKDRRYGVNWMKNTKSFYVMRSDASGVQMATDIMRDKPKREKDTVDHINHDTLNNDSRTNLRWASPSEQEMNKRFRK